MPKDKPVVTVVCLTFNHASYVAKALDSFLKQETDFAFTVLVHDDASTDGTAQIVQRYANDHPDIIRPILQTENQYSQGVKVLAHVLSMVQTEFAAVCEGDDFWTDSRKLQRQVDWMRANPEGSLCVHATLMTSPDGRPVGEMRARSGDGDLTLKEILVGHDSIHTSSLLLRSAMVRELPRFYHLAPVGDRPLKMHLATCGTVHYLDAVMSTYRYGVSGSWTDRMKEPQVALNHARRTLDYLDEFNRHTRGQHSDIVLGLSAPFRRRLLASEMEQAMESGRYADLLDARFAQVLTPRTRLLAHFVPLVPRATRPLAAKLIMALPSLKPVARRAKGILMHLAGRPQRRRE